MTTQQQILDAVEAYFDCALTDVEERRLAQMLVQTPSRHPRLEEARAVMGLGAEWRRRHALRSRRRVPRGVPWLSAAAAVALVVTLTVGLVRLEQSRSQCYAYVGSERITDEAAVNALLLANLSDMGRVMDEADRELAESLSLFAEENF